MQKESPFNLKSKLRRSVTSIQDHNKNRFLIPTIDEAGEKNEKKKEKKKRKKNWLF